MSTSRVVARGVIASYLVLLAGQSLLGVVGLAQLGALTDLLPWTIFWLVRAALELTVAWAVARGRARAEAAALALFGASLLFHFGTAFVNPIAMRENRVLLHLLCMAALVWLRRPEPGGA